MKRSTYYLQDPHHTVHARIVIPEEEPVPLEPWMLYKINNEGWRLVEEKYETTEDREPGVALHGWADWRGVSDRMAEVLRLLLADEVELDEGQALEVLGNAQTALDDYDVAVMEVSVAEGAAEEPEESNESDDEPSEPEAEEDADGSSED